MRVKSIFSGSWAIFLLAALAMPALAENARLPYRMLFNAEITRARLNRAHTNLFVVLTMQSTQPDVKTSDLTVYIDSKSGRIPVEVNPAGEFDVPVRDDLLSEDPWVIVNQPKGTMKLDWKVALVPGRLTNSMSYARLMGPLRESEQVQQEIRRAFSGGPPRPVAGLKLTFPARRSQPGGHHSRQGRRPKNRSERSAGYNPAAGDGPAGGRPGNNAVQHPRRGGNHLSAGKRVKRNRTRLAMAGVLA